MAKPSRGGTRYAAGQKKAKKRFEPQSSVPVPASAATQEPAQPEEKPVERTSGSALQFRPRARETSAVRSAGARGVAAKTHLQPIDYSYVYTDLRIIGVLTTVLLVALVALSFMLH